MSSATSGSSRRRWLVAPVLLVALVLPALSWRAGLESSVWMDEIHSLQLAHLTPAQILDLSGRDAHPPGYALALKGWLAAGRLLGIDPGIGWARGLGVAAWLALVAALWWLVGRLAGRPAAALAVVVVGGGALVADQAVGLRGYGLASAAVVVAFLAGLLAEGAARSGATARAAGWWLAHAALAALALWTHLLAAPLLALAAVVWAARALGGPRHARRRRIALVAASQGLAALAFLPWISHVPAQVGRLERAGTEWMTPATGRELAFVFTYRYPFGPVARPDVPPWAWLNLLGAAAVLVPAVAAASAALRRRRLSPLAAGGPVAAGFALLLWSLARWEVAPVFHGPRYPALAVGLWGLGLAGLALAGAGRRGGRREAAAASWLLLAPWLAAAGAGHLLALRQEAQGGLPEARPALAAALGSPAEPLYLSPSELAPFFHRSLEGLRVAPAEEVACGLVERGRAALLDLNPWPELERSRDRVLARAVNRGQLAAQWAWEELPATALGATLLRLEGAGPRAAELCTRRLAPPRPWQGEPAALALPEDQRTADGWTPLEIGDDLVPRRWGRRAEVTVRFDRRLPPGRYVLHVVAHRAAAPRPREVVCVEPPGAERADCAEQVAGRFEARVPFTLERKIRRPRARLRHPSWSPADAFGSRDRRRLTLLLEAAWIERGT